MKHLLIVFLIVVSGAFTSATLFTICGGSATSFYINVEGCEDGVNDRCVFIKGSSYGFTIGGISTTSALSTDMNTTVKFVPSLTPGIPITILDTDACDDLQVGECPMEFGEEFEYDRFRFNVPNNHPAIWSDMLIEIKDENEEHIFCGKFKFGIYNNGNSEEDHIN